MDIGFFHFVFDGIGMMEVDGACFLEVQSEIGYGGFLRAFDDQAQEMGTAELLALRLEWGHPALLAKAEEDPLIILDHVEDEVVELMIARVDEALIEQVDCLQQELLNEVLEHSQLQQQAMPTLIHLFGGESEDCMKERMAGQALQQKVRKESDVVPTFFGQESEVVQDHFCV